MSQVHQTSEATINAIEDFNVHLREKYHYPDVYAQRFARATACAESDGSICGAVACEKEGVQQIMVQILAKDGGVKELSIKADMPTMPAAAAGPDGSFLILYVNYTGTSWQVCLASIRGTDVETTLLYESEGLCHQTALISDGEQWHAAWSGLGANGRFQIFLCSNGNVTVMEEADHCFRPALAADGNRLYLAYDKMGITQSAVLRVLGQESSLRYCLTDTEESYYSCSLAAHGGECGLAAVSLRLARDTDRDIADHSTSICFWNWTEDGLSQKEEAANLDEGLLGKRVYVPYFGVRRRCILLPAQDGYELFFEKRFEHEREDVLIDYDPNKLCYEHYGYLIRKSYRDGRWQPGIIAHESGSCYSLAARPDGGVAASYLVQHNVYELPKFRQSCLTAESIKPLDEQYENPNFSVEPYQAEDVPHYHRDDTTLYWGDTHVHSLSSPDAEGESDMLMRYARHVAALDFVALVDNDYYPHTGLCPVDFARQKAIAEALTEKDAFLAIPAIEFTCHESRLDPNFNHRYVLYFGESDYCSRTFPQTRNVRELAEALSGEKVIMVAHHPHWELTGAKEDQFVEICSSWRISMEEKNFILQALARQQKFAFVGSSDTHRAVGGMGGALTGVYASSLSPDGLYDGYRSRRTIASQGLKIAIDLSVADAFIGGEAVCSGAPQVSLKVRSPQPLEFVEVIRDGIVIARYNAPDAAMEAVFTDDSAALGQHFYYVRVKAVGEPSYNEIDSVKDQPSGPFVRTGRYPFNFARARGPFAWCSPIFVTID